MPLNTLIMSVLKTETVHRKQQSKLRQNRMWMKKSSFFTSLLTVYRGDSSAKASIHFCQLLCSNIVIRYWKKLTVIKKKSKLFVCIWSCMWVCECVWGCFWLISIYIFFKKKIAILAPLYNFLCMTNRLS